MRMFDMANDSHLFHTHEQLTDDGWALDGNVFTKDGQRMLPLYEGKMAYHYDHRYGDFRDRAADRVDSVLPRVSISAKALAEFVVQPRYWVQEFNTLDAQRSKPGKPAYHFGVASRLAARDWHHGWLLGWRDITNPTNEHTVISGVIPVAAVGHTFPLALIVADRPDCLEANLTSFVLDYAARQKLAGMHMTYSYFNQLPVLPPSAYDEPVRWFSDAAPVDWIRERVLELSFTAWDMEAFARDMGDGWPPFRWDEVRRTLIQAELDAAFFHLYGLDRDEVEHVMDSFDTLCRREEKQFGEFRTRRLILDRYDVMADAARTGAPYQTILDPPPGHGPRHSPRLEP
jgi:hypothetical protein